MVKIKNEILLMLSLLLLMFGGCSNQTEISVKPKLMWIDCSANWVRFSNPDTISYYVQKCKKAGITTLVLDVKGTSGEVVYPSSYAPQIKEWKGVVRPDFGFVETFIKEAHKNELEILAAFNTFAGGNGVFRRGILYSEHPEWQAVNYVPGKGMIPVLEIEDKKVLFTNPALPEVRQHAIHVFKELVEKYDFDGIMLDRARYDNIQSDFSDYSKELFEKYIGKQIERYPEDIYEWVDNGDGGYKRVNGKYFKEWIEWRASVIYSFFKETREAVKGVNPKIKFATYTGAWYPSYYEVGVNWASNTYDASSDFDWATPRYSDYGYAELLDLYTNGNYYWNVSLAEYHKSIGKVKNETDSEFSTGDHLCVEGGCIYSRKLLGKNPFLGGLYVEDYKHDVEQFKRAVEMNLKMSDGVMIFDIVHIIDRDWWQPLSEAMAVKN